MLVFVASRSFIAPISVLVPRFCGQWHFFGFALPFFCWSSAIINLISLEFRVYGGASGSKHLPHRSYFVLHTLDQAFRFSAGWTYIDFAITARVHIFSVNQWNSKLWADDADWERERDERRKSIDIYVTTVSSIIVVKSGHINGNWTNYLASTTFWGRSKVQRMETRTLAMRNNRSTNTLLPRATCVNMHHFSGWYECYKYKPSILIDYSHSPLKCVADGWSEFKKWTTQKKKKNNEQIVEKHVEKIANTEHANESQQWIARPFFLCCLCCLLVECDWCMLL